MQHTIHAAACALVLMITPLASGPAQGGDGASSGPNAGATGTGPAAPGLTRMGPTTGPGMTPGAGGTAGVTGMATGTGLGATGTAPGYGGTAGAGTTTGSTMGTGTGVGIGSTMPGHPTAQSPLGENPAGPPIAPSTTPGGPPNASASNLPGTNGGSMTGR
jgi:hypothetical protein